MNQTQLNAAVSALRRLGVPGALRAADHLELAAKDSVARGNRWEERLCYSLREALEEIPVLFGQPRQGEPLGRAATSFLQDLGDLIDVPANSVPNLEDIRALVTGFQAALDEAGMERRVRVAQAMMYQARTGRTSPQVDAFAAEWAGVIGDANALLHTGNPSGQAAETLLERTTGLLAALVVPLSDRLEEVDALAAMKDPDESDVQQLRRLLADERLARYFFTKVGPVEWLAPLDAARFFAPPMRGDWYQGAFLERVAADDPALARDIISRFVRDRHPAAGVVVTEVVTQLGPSSSAYLERTLEGPAFENSWAVSHALSGLLEVWSQRHTTESFPPLADRALEPMERVDALGRVAGKFSGSDFKRLVDGFVSGCHCEEVYALTEILAYKLRRAVAISRPGGELISMTRDLVDEDEHDDRDISHALISGLRDALRRMRSCGERVERREAAVGALDNEVLVRIWAGHLAEEEGEEVA